jgi:ankyrin repeat protein
MDLFEEDRDEDDIIALIDSREDKYEMAKNVDRYGDTLLMKVLHWRSPRHRVTKLVEYLLQLGSDPNVTNRHGGTPLERACWSIDVCSLSVYENVNLILSYGANPNDGVRTAVGSILYRCVVYGSQKIMTAIALHGGQMADAEYDRLIKKGRIRSLVDFYDNLRLSHLAYTHIKRMQRCNK